MSGRTPLSSVSLGTALRPLFQNTFFSSKGTFWDLYLEGELVHIVDESSKSRGHGIVHIASCCVEVEPGAALPKKPRRGRPPKAREEAAA